MTTMVWYTWILYSSLVIILLLKVRDYICTALVLQRFADLSRDLCTDIKIILIVIVPLMIITEKEELSQLFCHLATRSSRHKHCIGC